jgi:O-antigen/teichoic acid export membrane protein
MAGLGIVPFGLLGYFGSEILAFILGDRWVVAGVYTQILAPWYYAVWVSAGVQPTLVALRRQGLWLRFQIVTLLGRLAIFGAGYLIAADVETTLIWFSGFNVAMALLILSIVFYILKTETGDRKEGT